MLPPPVAKNFTIPTPFRSGSIFSVLSLGKKISELVEIKGNNKNYYTPRDFQIDKVFIEGNIYNNIQGTIKDGDLKVIGVNDSKILTVDLDGDIKIFANNPVFIDYKDKIINVDIMFTITDEISGKSDTGIIEFEIDNTNVPVAKNFIIANPFRSGLIITDLNFGEKISDLVEMEGFDKKYYKPSDFNIIKVIIEDNEHNKIQGSIKNDNLIVIGDEYNILTVDKKGYIAIYTDNSALLDMEKNY